MSGSDRSHREPPAGASTQATPTRPTPEMIERFRRTGIRLDRAGRLWHEGQEISHRGLRRALLRWLDRREEDGRPILRLDERRYAYIDVEDAELLVTALTWQGDRATLFLNDDSSEELAYDTLRVGEDNALYCAVRGGRLEARLTTPAYYALADHIEELADGRFALRAAGALHAVGVRQRQR